jgi:hypothetical protein
MNLSVLVPSPDPAAVRIEVCPYASPKPIISLEKVITCE